MQSVLQLRKRHSGHDIVYRQFTQFELMDECVEKQHFSKWYDAGAVCRYRPRQLFSNRVINGVIIEII